MFQNIIKTAIRSFWKSKTISFINIIGLGAGLATCILLLLYIWNESSYDKHHQDKENLYRVGVNFTNGKAASSPAPMAEGMKSEFPEIIEATRLFKYFMLESMLLRYEEGTQLNAFYETNGYYADASFFEVFDYGFIEGNPGTALLQPNSVVLSSSLAQKIFGDRNPLNEVLKVGLPKGDYEYTVRGVFEDEGIKSHINARFFLSMVNNDSWEFVDAQTSWAFNNMFHTYIKIEDSADPEALEAKMNDYFIKKLGENAGDAGLSKNLFLQPVKDIYLTSDLAYEIEANGNLKLLYVFGSIGFFILLIACINFMNLSTAKSEKRAKEVGIRKVIGAQKEELVKQFLGESLLMSFVSLGLAILILQVLLPFFNNFTGKSLQVFENPLVLSLIAGMTVVTGIIAGLYPAFYLSAFRPVSILKGSKGNGFSAAVIRKGLVIFQFVISVVLIAVAIVINSQMSFMQNTSLGFDKEQQLVLSLQSSEAISNFEALKNALEDYQGIQHTSGGSTYPGMGIIQDWLLYPEGKTVEAVEQVMIGEVTNDYIETLGMELLAGRSFSDQYSGDGDKMILNETAAVTLGFEPEEALGRKVIFEWEGEKTEHEIVGVIKDFHFQSLHQRIRPFGLVKTEKPAYLIAKIQAGKVNDILNFTERTWKTINASTPFTYSFLDQDFQRNYEREKRTSTIILYFTVIAILVSCIGLFGLVAFTAEQKTKEIGIRKVLGATPMDINALVSKEFLTLIGVAILIAAPLGYFVADKWLEGFVYKINLSLWTFLVAGLVAAVIAYVTISFHAVKAAIMNPVDSLKHE